MVNLLLRETLFALLFLTAIDSKKGPQIAGLFGDFAVSYINAALHTTRQSDSATTNCSSLCMLR